MILATAFVPRTRNLLYIYYTFIIQLLYIYYTIIYNYIQLYTIIYNYIQLYTIIYNYIQLYTIIYNVVMCECCDVWMCGCVNVVFITKLKYNFYNVSVIIFSMLKPFITVSRHFYSLSDVYHSFLLKFSYLFDYLFISLKILNGTPLASYFKLKGNSPFKIKLGRLWRPILNLQWFIPVYDLLLLKFSYFGRTRLIRFFSVFVGTQDDFGIFTIVIILFVLVCLRLRLRLREKNRHLDDW
jgi:hypothetical protein